MEDEEKALACSCTLTVAAEEKLGARAELMRHPDVSGIPPNDVRAFSLLRKTLPKYGSREALWRSH